MTNRSDADDGSLPLDSMRLALDLEIPSDVRYIEQVVELVTKQCAQLSFTARHCAFNVPVALSEALANAILRGNREDREKHVRIHASLDYMRLVMEVADEGEGFDLEDCTIDPTTEENIERVDGRGLFLMRKLMDSVERFNDHGNVVRLTLRRA
jgi:serine/threonine-protein kinase RsbW